MQIPPTVTLTRTEELSSATKNAITQLCIAAHDEPDFQHLFTYITGGGRHCLAYLGAELVSHAVVTTRWLQPENLPVLKTAYVDAVSTLPAYQGRGYGSAVMQHLAEHMADYEIAALETDRIGFYERLGWQVWCGALAGRSEDGLVPTPEVTGVMI
jgi:aminoglycoside 2'-N-acetyltransferase I